MTPIGRTSPAFCICSVTPFLVLVATEDPRPEHLVIELTSADLKRGDDLVGLPLVSAFPGVAGDVSMLKELARLARHGGRFVRGTQSAGMTTAPWDLEPGQLRAVRTGRRGVLTWHTPDFVD